MEGDYVFYLVRTAAVEVTTSAQFPVWAPVVIETILCHRKIFHNYDRATSYWCDLFNQTILRLQHAANGPSEGIVQETPQLETTTIEWVKPHKFIAFDAMSDLSHTGEL